MSISRSRSRRKFEKRKQENQENYINRNTRYFYVGYLVLAIIISGFTIYIGGALFKSEQEENVSKYPYYENIESDIILISTSWSDSFFNGKLTASGEFFDSNSFTAAHPTLAFGTEIIVINPENSHMIKVRINDRSTDGLILSERAAQALDIREAITELKTKVITIAE